MPVGLVGVRTCLIDVGIGDDGVRKSIFWQNCCPDEMKSMKHYLSFWSKGNCAKFRV